MIQIPLSKSILPKHPFDFLTLEQSRVLSGLSPPLQISQRVVPKPHLSVAKLRFWGFSMHSGGTHGIRSTRTGKAQRKGDTWVDETVEIDSKEITPNQTIALHRCEARHATICSPSLGSTVMLIPGSLSLMKGKLPVVRSSSLIRRTFLAQTFPWMRFLSSCVQMWQVNKLLLCEQITQMCSREKVLLTFSLGGRLHHVLPGSA